MVSAVNRLIGIPATLYMVAVPMAAHAQIEADIGSSDADTYFGVEATADIGLGEATRVYLRGAAYDGPVWAGYALAEVRHDLNEIVTLEGGYFGLFLPDSPARPEFRDNRIRGAVALTRRFGRFELSHRSRVEHRFRDVSDGFRYRPGFGVAYALPEDWLATAALVRNETFYDFDADKVTRNHLTTGIVFPVRDGVSLTPAYQWQRDRTPLPDNHVISVVVGLNL